MPDPSDPLDRVLAAWRDPIVPDGMVDRIVAKATASPQRQPQSPREAPPQFRIHDDPCF